MYTIQVKVSTDKDMALIAQKIAQIVESATGKRCRVSVLNKRLNIRREQNKLMMIQEKLKDGPTSTN